MKGLLLKAAVHTARMRKVYLGLKKAQMKKNPHQECSRKIAYSAQIDTDDESYGGKKSVQVGTDSKNDESTKNVPIGMEHELDEKAKNAQIETDIKLDESKESAPIGIEFNAKENKESAQVEIDQEAYRSTENAQIGAGIKMCESTESAEIRTDIQMCASTHSASDKSQEDDTDRENGGQEKSKEGELGIEQKRRLKNVESFLKQDEKSRNKLVIPPAWQALLDSILENSQSGQSIDAVWHMEHYQKAPIVAVCGGKSVGKSTLARYLVNNFIKSFPKVGYLDTDVGQPNLTPPGCLSLHILDKTISGPVTLELRHPDRLYFYGDVSPQGNPELYMLSIRALYDFFYEKYYKVDICDNQSQIPLVINTHGWIRGVGYDILVDILRYTVPTHVVQVLSQADKKNLPCNMFWKFDDIKECTTKLLYVNSAVEATNMHCESLSNARHLRELRVVSYFRDCIRKKQNDGYLNRDMCAETAKALISHKPYQVPISMIQIMHPHFQVPPSESLSSVNGMLVGLGMSSTSKHCGGVIKTLPPICVGLGIVRGIDKQKGCFYVITPVPLEKLQAVDIFLQGRIDLPICLLQVPGYYSPYLCQNSIATEGTGSASIGSGKKKLLRGHSTRRSSIRNF